MRSVISGVPQRSVLGPLIFGVFKPNTPTRSEQHCTILRRLEAFSQCNVGRQYFLHKTELNIVSPYTDLGVIVAEDLSWYNDDSSLQKI